MYLSGEISGQREIMSQFLISWFLGWKENIMFCHTRYLPNLISCCWSSCWGEQYLLDCCSKLHPDLTPEVGGWRVYHFILMLLLKINTYLLRTWSLPWLNGEINPQYLHLFWRAALCARWDKNTFQEIQHSITSVSKPYTKIS